MTNESAEAGAEAHESIEDAPEQEALARLLSAVKRRPALSIFLFGLLLFTGGLASVVSNQIGNSARTLPEQLKVTPASRASPKDRVGPAFGEAVDPYIVKKKSTLTERAKSDPKGPTLALVVFNQYRTGAETEVFLKARGLEPLTAQVRVSVPGSKPEEVSLESKTLADASGGIRDSLKQELDALEDLAARTTDPGFREVYSRDARLYEEALGKLAPDPATIFAVVVRSTHASLASTAKATEVRFVDLPDDQTATLEDTTFSGVIPEDTETATFAVR